MTSINAIMLDADDTAAANRFYADAFGLGSQVRVQTCDAPTTGFRGYTLSLIVSQPATVTTFFDSALEAGASPLKPVAKSFWGYGGVVHWQRTPGSRSTAADRIGS